MLLSRKLLALLVSASLGGATLDHPRSAGRVLAWPLGGSGGAQASTPGPPASVPPFTLFGWISPPVWATSDAHIAEMAEAGMTLVLPAWADSGFRADNLARMDLAAAHGMRCLVWDRRFERVEALGDTTPAAGALMDSIVADYRDHPGFFGYYLGDEPHPEQWPFLARLFAALRARDPDHPAWNNLLGRGSYPDRAQFLAALRGYAGAVHPAVLGDDYYEFTLGGDRGLFFENLAGLNAVARGAGLPFWLTVLLIGHTGYRQPSPAELSWQAAMALAYGARGVGYFTWWTPWPYDTWLWQPAVIDTSGNRTAWFDELVRADPGLAAAGRTLAGCGWLAATHAGGVPPGGTAFAPDADLAGVSGRAVLGHFADPAGGRCLMVVNADSLRPQRITLLAARALSLDRLQDGVWAPMPGAASGESVPIDLTAGAFALLRIRGSVSARGGDPPRIRIDPVPARAMVRISVSHLGVGGRIELIDLTGRRVWWRPIGPANGTLEWRGEREGGSGRAEPGVYFVRAETPRGISVARLQWLGGT
jgi:hypothetical protein